MAFELYFHPFSSYCQKALVALYENEVPFESQLLEGPDSPAMRRLAELWPMKRFPLLVDGARTVFEATCIIEYVDLKHPGPVRLIPADADEALQVRLMDRFFDNYVSTPQQRSCSTRCARRRSATPMAWPRRAPCSTPPTRGSTA